MTDPPVGTWLWQSIVVVAAALVAMMLIIAWYVRFSGRPAARVTGAVVGVVALGLSGTAVDTLVQARVDAWTRGRYAFVCILPGYVVWAPAVISVLFLAVYLVSTRRGARGLAA